MKYNFQVKRPDESWDDAFNTTHFTYQQAVQVAADHYFYRRDGHTYMVEGQNSEFHVRREGENHHQEFMVEVEYDPVFVCHEK